MPSTTLINPADGTAFQSVEQTSLEQVNDAVARALVAQATWRALTPAARGGALRDFATVVSSHLEELAALEVVKLRLARSAYQQAVGLANVFFGESAKAAGWVDEVVPAEKVLERAEEAAHEFAKLHRGAHAASKLRARAEALEAIRAGIENMPAEFGVPS